MNHRQRSAGFSLLEIIVALGIFMVGGVSVMSLFAVGAAHHRRAIDNSNAARAARSIFAELEAKWTLVADAEKRRPKKSARKGRGKNRDGSDGDYPVPGEGAGPWRVPGFPQYEYEVEYTPIDPEENAVMCTLSIKWKRRGKGRTQFFKRLLLRRPF